MYIKKIINNPLPSNCYIIVNEGHCLIVDPGSKDCTSLITFLKSNNFVLDLIVLTHEHFDHVWGADILREQFMAPIVCSLKCMEKLSIPQNYFNLLYFEDGAYFSIQNIDKVISDDTSIEWMGYLIKFVLTPGHTKGSICFSIGNSLFTGDTIMNGAKPLIKRHEGSWSDYRESLQKIYSNYSEQTRIYPGHGNSLLLSDVSPDYFVDI